MLAWATPIMPWLMPQHGDIQISPRLDPAVKTRKLRGAEAWATSLWKDEFTANLIADSELCFREAK